jgi:hypothetical protein
MAIEAPTEALLNPAQQAVLDLLGAPLDERPTFARDLRDDLLADLEAALLPLLDTLPDDDTLFVSKRHLTQVHGCPQNYLAERDEPFSWSPPLARGTVAHKAIELSVNWRGDTTPAELVDEAVARLSEGMSGLADWLQTRSEADLAEVRGVANERVTMFVECFPPLKRQWTPVTEAPVRIELFDARVVLSGRIDLSLGRPQGDTAGKVIIDLKTGGFSAAHLDDLRFYALLDTLRLGTPPRLLASYYLDNGRAHVEQVTVELLHTALARTVDGVARIVDLVHGDGVAGRRPGRSCRWCPALTDCADGRAHLDGTALDLSPEGGDDLS